MWTYYGTKKRIAKNYLAPIYDTIIEPFAGAVLAMLVLPHLSICFPFLYCFNSFFFTLDTHSCASTICHIFIY